MDKVDTGITDIIVSVEAVLLTSEHSLRHRAILLIAHMQLLNIMLISCSVNDAEMEEHHGSEEQVEEQLEPFDCTAPVSSPHVPLLLLLHSLFYLDGLPTRY